MLNRTHSMFVAGALVASACAYPINEDEILVDEIQALATARQCPALQKVEPGKFSTDRDEGRLMFTPDGKTAYFHRADENFIYSIMESRFVNGAWTTPVVASFSGHDDIDAFITADGKELWFSSWRGVDGGPSRPDTDLWKVTRVGNGWSDPVHIALSSEYYENFPSITADGTLYFNTNRAAPTPSTFDGWDIYSAKKVGNGYGPIERLGSGVNTVENWEFNPALLADGRVLLFSSIRDTGFGGPDLYASARVGETWRPAVNLGACINGADGEFHPSYSTARRRLAFVRSTEATLGDLYEVSFGF